MSLENVLFFGGKELVHNDGGRFLAGKEVTAMGEFDFSAPPNLINFLVCFLLHSVSKHVHHTNFVEKADNDLETARVESNAERFFGELLVDFQSETHCGRIAPQFNSLILRACHNKILLDANIHSLDGSRVERMYQIVICGLHIFVIKQ